MLVSMFQHPLVFRSLVSSRPLVTYASLAMAVTRSKITVVKTSVENHNGVQTVEKVTKTKKVKTTIPGTPKSKVKASSANASPRKKPHIEELFAVVDIPEDLLLPQTFIDRHKPEFIKGVNYILLKDPSLYPCIVHLDFKAFSNKVALPETEDEVILRYWYALISSVIGQQVSGHAAKAIEGRFKLLFEDGPTPQDTLKKSPEELRAVGLLAMKLKYVISISEAFSSPDSKLVSLDFYRSSTNQEIIDELVLLKGIGEWSAKMFSVFTLKELDIFAYDDLGVARGVARYLENRPQLLKDIQKGVNEDELLKLGLKKKGKFQTKSSKRDWVPLHDEYVKYLGKLYSPYLLVLMLIMWRLASTNVEILENVR